jgi:hypothetical protein
MRRRRRFLFFFLSGSLLGPVLTNLQVLEQIFNAVKRNENWRSVLHRRPNIMQTLAQYLRSQVADERKYAALLVSYAVEKSPENRQMVLDQG